MRLKKEGMPNEIYKKLFSIMLLGTCGSLAAADWSPPIDVNAGTYGHSAVDVGDINQNGRPEPGLEDSQQAR